MGSKMDVREKKKRRVCLEDKVKIERLVDV